MVVCPSKPHLRPTFARYRPTDSKYWAVLDFFPRLISGPEVNSFLSDILGNPSNLGCLPSTGCHGCCHLCADLLQRLPTSGHQRCSCHRWSERLGSHHYDICYGPCKQPEQEGLDKILAYMYSRLGYWFTFEATGLVESLVYTFEPQTMLLSMVLYWRKNAFL